LASFEESLKKLESIVGKLEQGDLPLEESIRLFEEGIQLSDACKKELEAAEGKVQMLLKQKDGSMKAAPFPSGAGYNSVKQRSQAADTTDDDDIPF
jgi:exodeoxyribonuclease VII small subunit